MGLRGWLNRLERGASGDLDSFRLRDDTTYYYDRLETSKELYCHAYDVQLGDADKWPEPRRSTARSPRPRTLPGRLRS
jgi:hypothetical protein